VTEREPWHLDRRVPVAFIFTLIVQFLIVVWMVATTSHQVETNTRDIAVQARLIEQIRSDSQTQAVQLGRIEEAISGMRSDMERVLQALERAR
jgi:type II secretory pathway component PulK